MKSASMKCTCCGKEFWCQTVNDTIQCMDCGEVLTVPDAPIEVASQPVMIEEGGQ